MTTKPIKSKPFAVEAVERTERMAKRTKTLPMPPGKTLEQVADDFSRESMAWLQVFQALHFLEENPLVTPSPSALDFVRVTRELARTGAFADGVEDVLRPVDELLPKGKHGKKFTGRKPGAFGPLRKWVEKFIGKYPTATPSQAWAALKSKPPKAISVDDNFTPTLWVDGTGQVTYKTFQNLVGEVKKQRRE